MQYQYQEEQKRYTWYMKDSGLPYDPDDFDRLVNPYLTYLKIKDINQLNSQSVSTCLKSLDDLIEKLVRKKSIVIESLKRDHNLEEPQPIKKPSSKKTVKEFRWDLVPTGSHTPPEEYRKLTKKNSQYKVQLEAYNQYKKDIAEYDRQLVPIEETASERYDDRLTSLEDFKTYFNRNTEKCFSWNWLLREFNSLLETCKTSRRYHVKLIKGDVEKVESSKTSDQEKIREFALTLQRHYNILADSSYGTPTTYGKGSKLMQFLLTFAEEYLSLDLFENRKNLEKLYCTSDSLQIKYLLMSGLVAQSSASYNNQEYSSSSLSEEYHSYLFTFSSMLHQLSAILLERPPSSSSSFFSSSSNSDLQKSIARLLKYTVDLMEVDARSFDELKESMSSLLRCIQEAIGDIPEITSKSKSTLSIKNELLKMKTFIEQASDALFPEIENTEQDTISFTTFRHQY